MLSLPHLIIVFVVALVVFGPEKLPELAKNFGKFMAEFRRMTGEFKSTFEGHMRDLEREADERRKPAPAAPPAPTENSIRGETAPSADDAAAATGLPMPTPAQGIVPSADPRIPPAEASPSATSNGSGANGTAASASADGPAETPEPVTDGQHQAS